MESGENATVIRVEDDLQPWECDVPLIDEIDTVCSDLLTNDFVIKPYDAKDLLKKIEKLLKQAA